MQFSETRMDILNTRDGLELDIHIWEPENPDAILLAVHGGLAHAGDYITPALFFKQKGIATLSYDLRGHKQKKVCIDNFKQFIDDTGIFLKWVENHYPGIPIFYMGHSVGALIGTYIGLESVNEPGFKGYIFSSPYYQNAIKVNPLIIPIIKIMSKICPDLPVPNQDITQFLTHDKNITRRHRLDEKKGLRAARASMRFGSQLFAAQNLVKKNIQNWKYPVFAVVAGNDQVADADETKRLLKKIDPDLLTYIFHKDNYHENFNEINREETFQKIYIWIKSFMTN